MILPAITLLALAAGVRSQERFLNNALVTVTRTTTQTTTSTLVPTCFEIVSTTQCARKKKQLAFLVNPLSYYQAGVLPHSVVPMQVSEAPAVPFYSPLRFFQSPYLPVFGQSRTKEQSDSNLMIDSSLSEKAEGQARFFGTNLIKFTYLTSTVTVPTVASNTQTFQVSCLAAGQTSPLNTCIIRITFPPVPAGITLQAYCQSLATAAKMSLAECKYASRRRRQADSTSRVIVGFKGDPYGPPASRKLIAENINDACGSKASCTLPGGITFALDKVEVPGFANILQAAGSSISTFTSKK